MIYILFSLWAQLSRRRHHQFGLVAMLAILAAFAEAVAIGAVVPLLGVLAAPEKMLSTSWMAPLVDWLKPKDLGQLLLPMVVFFCLAAVVSCAVRLAMLYVTNKYSYAVGADLRIAAFDRELYQPYGAQIRKNSSETISGIITKIGIIPTGVVLPVVTIISNSVMAITIISALTIIDWVIASISFGVFGSIYLLISRTTGHRLYENSEIVSREASHVIKALQEGIGGIRQILIDGSQNAFSRIFRDSERRFRQAETINAFIGGSPRYIIECLGIIFIAGLACTVTFREGGFAESVPILGALALGAQRLLPVLQQIYGSFATLRGYRAYLYDIVRMLEQPLPPRALAAGSVPPLPFNNEILLDNVRFRYSIDAQWVLRSIDLRIARGSKIGVIGATGCGKSTLLDIIMGLLLPVEGSISVDGRVLDVDNMRSWQRHIAHVPQSIYLSDSSVAENIAFGIPSERIDWEKVKMSAISAQISDVIEGWESKYHCLVGERGVRLSGGQRQRIGIARALYRDADVIVFDEATSALDSDTENAVMDAIYDLGRDITIVMVAHRLSTLRHCDCVVELADGQIIRVGRYEDFVGGQ